MEEIHIPGLGRLVAALDRVSTSNHRGGDFWSIFDLDSHFHLSKEML